VNEARRRGIEAVLLDRNDDLRTLVLDALADGADALGVAGGDGSQAIVASIAIEHGVPFVCVPAGTRNHLALDLGVDRDDVVRALDAFAAGPERLVDVGLVGDRVFVNNVSFGVYGEVVESQSYRDAKLRTAAAQMPELLGPGGRAPELRFPGPDGAPRSTRELVLVSNNPYQFGARDGFGTRPRLDTGTLGVLSVRVDNARDAARFSALALAGRAWAFPGCETWTTTTFTLEADAAVAAGIDGESVRLEPPVRFRTRPHALRVWLAEDAPATCRRAEPVRLEPETMAHLWAEARGRP
jgi:diacylglycerol kinase family enzyme